jgi:hypothetical protein
MKCHRDERSFDLMAVGVVGAGVRANSSWVLTSHGGGMSSVMTTIGISGVGKG